MTSERLTSLWADIEVALPARYATLQKRPPKVSVKAGATEAQLRALESHWEFELPPSYRALLSMFNGAKNFAYTTPLLSTGQIIRGDSDWDLVEEVHEELVPYVFAGSDDSDLFFMFDPSARGVDGELEVVVLTSDGTEERHPTIVDFLEAYLGALRAGIERDRLDRQNVK